MLIKSGLVVSVLTFCSRIFGLVRELFIAYTFGSTWVADCVHIAFKFPNFFRRISGDGALVSAFVPIYTEALEKKRDHAIEFSGKVFTLLLIILIAASIIMQIFMPYFMLIIAPGFILSEHEKYKMAVLLCRITTPYMIFVSVTALFGGMLNSSRRFAAFAFSPIIMNICVVGFTLLLNNDMESQYAISISLIIAGFFQVLIIYFALFRAGLSFSLKIDFKDKAVTRMFKNMIPAGMSAGTQQLNLFISQSIASFIPSAVSTLAYADRLYQFPLALIGITFGTILLPELSRQYSKDNIARAHFLQNKSLQIALTVSMPAMVGLIILAHPIMHIIYERGQFTSTDTINTSYTLIAFACGLPAFVMAKIFIAIFYANKDTKTPFKITVYTVIVNIILNIILMMPYGFIGIALGSSIAAWFNTCMLYKNSRKYGNFVITIETWVVLSKIIFTSIIMFVFLWFVNNYYACYFYTDSLLKNAIALICVIISSILIFGSLAFILKVHKNLMNK